MKKGANDNNYIISINCKNAIFNFPSSDNMNIYYTEQDYQINLKNFEFNLKFHQNTT